MIVLDSSVLIAYLDSEDRHHVAAEALLTEAVGEDLGVNSLTLAEVLVVPARDGRLDLVRAVLRDLEVAELPFPADTAVKLAQLRANTGLKMPDCGVLLAAENSGARVACFDDRLALAAEDRDLEVLGR